MSDHERQLSPEEVAQTTANLRLAAQFVRDVIDHPERYEDLPDGGTVVLLPGDDTRDLWLTQANIQMAIVFNARGQRITTWVVGAPALTGSQIVPRWPLVRREQSRITYDRRPDVLTIVLSEAERPAIPVRLNSLATALVDPETHLVISVTIPRFLAEAAPKSLALFDLLLLPSTELIGVTRNQILSVRNKIARGQPFLDRDDMTVSEFVDNLTKLIA